MPLRAAMTVLVLILLVQPSLASERLLKLRQYTFSCGPQDCTGWRHSFGFIDPAARNAELPRDAYVDVYTTQEVDALVEAALARRADAIMSGASDDERRKLRDDIAAEVLAQFTRLMAEHEAQTRAWLQDFVRQELKAGGSR